MRGIVFSLFILFLVGLSWMIPVEDEAFASTMETDRMIVEIVDENGRKAVESVSIDELKKFNAGKSLKVTSLLHNVQSVKVLEPDFIRQTALQTDSVKVKSWGTERVGVKNLKSKVAPLEGSVIVAVIDTGIDHTHKFLKDRIVKGYDAIGNQAEPMAVHIHGTHVAGIIVDTTPANVKIMPIRVLDEEGKGYDSHVAQGIRYAVDNGADIINMSFGGVGFSQYLSDAIHYAYSKNVLVVVASGNDSGNTANYYPASDQRVLLVSAVDKNDTIASFSNTGTSVDVSAPGVDIISSVPGDRFESHSGTSMAAPYVSGIAAMLKLDEPIRSSRGIENLLKKYADDRGAIGWDSQYGAGIVNFSTYGESLIVDNEQAVVNKDETIAVAPKPTTKIISLPEQKNVPLDKVWTIEFDRQLTERDIITIKVFNDDKEIPISLTPNRARKEILVSATVPYHTRTAYRLVIQAGKGNEYQMDFVTGL